MVLPQHRKLIVSLLVASYQLRMTDPAAAESAFRDARRELVKANVSRAEAREIVEEARIKAEGDRAGIRRA